MAIEIKHVSALASGGGDGSSGDPWTIQEAITQNVTGKSGTLMKLWRDYDYFPTSELQINHTGISASNPVHYCGLTGPNPTDPIASEPTLGPIIDGVNLPASSTILRQTVSQVGLGFKGLRLINSDPGSVTINYGLQLANYASVEALEVKDCQQGIVIQYGHIYNCLVTRHFGGSGIRIVSDHGKVIGCRVYDPQDNNVTGISLGSYAIAMFNYINMAEKTGSLGIDSGGSPSLAQLNYNTIVYCVTGIKWWPHERSFIIGNIMQDNDYQLQPYSGAVNIQAFMVAHNNFRLATMHADFDTDKVFFYTDNTGEIVNFTDLSNHDFSHSNTNLIRKVDQGLFNVGAWQGGSVPPAVDGFSRARLINHGGV